MTKFRKCLPVILALVVLTTSALADYAVVSNTNSVNLREGPGYDYDVIGTASRGDWIDAQGESGAWYAVSIVKNGKLGYMDGNYLSFGGNGGSDAVIGVVNNPKASSFLNLREYPSYSANVLGLYYNGAECSILSSSNGWYEVEIDGIHGYFRYEYIKVKGASGTATVVSDNGKTVNLRSGPSTAYSVLQRVNPGRKVNVLLKGNGFWKIQVGNTVGYMSSSYLSTSSSIPTQGGATPAPTTSGYVVVANPNSQGLLNLREQPSTSAKVLAQYTNGTRFEVIAQGEKWCKVYGKASGRTGYVMTQYVRLYGLPSTPTKTVKNNGSYVNLRSSPSKATGSVLTRVNSGERVTVLTPGDEWTQVRYGSRTGYMMTCFLK